MSGELTNPRLGYRDPFVGRLLGDRFRLEHRIGSGAMGHVYRAADIQDGGEVAVKVLRPELMTDQGLMKRFRREARAAGAIESPHVVRILSWGEDGDVPFIAMELVRGSSLATVIEGGRSLSVVRACAIARCVAAALDAAHTAGVVHRDLKPENVVLVPDGRVKVVDFGIARLLDHSPARSQITSHLTMVGTILGTPLYMSPEAASRKAVGPKADVYALGVMIYEMIVGWPPFVDEDPIAILALHLKAEPPRILDVAPAAQVPPRLQGLVDQCMAKDPRARPTARELYERLENVAADTVPDAAPPVSLEETVRETLLDVTPGMGWETRARGRSSWFLGASVLVLLASLGVALLLSRAEPREATGSIAAHDRPAPTVTPPSAPTEPAASPPAPPPVPPTEPPAGILAVRAASRCALEIDGAPAGRAPVDGKRLEAGPHHLRCTTRDGRAAEADVHIHSDRTTEVTLTFPRRRRSRGSSAPFDIARDYR